MRALALLGVFVVAKLAVLAGRPLQLSAWTPVVYFWQDGLVALMFGAVDSAIRRPWFGWMAYAAAIFYIAINVAVERVISSPLTWPMIGAARGALSDSLRHHATLVNLALMILVAVSGLVLPWLLGRMKYRRRSIVVVVGLVLGLGPFACQHIETNGLDRNPILALFTTALPRLSTAAVLPESRKSWRTSPFGLATTAGENLSRLRGVGKNRNVVMIMLESAGAQYLHPYGSPTDPMPNLSKITESAVVFENAYAVYPESIRGLFSVLCSRYPAMDTAQESYGRITTPSLAMVLKEAGYHTGLFHSGRFMYLGMEAVVQNRGFDILEDAEAISGNSQSSFGVDEASTVRRTLAWIDSLPRNECFFLTYLPIAGHHPYDTPEPGPFAEHQEQDRYLNALNYADASIGTFLKALHDRGIDRNTLFVIFGDHGEAFGQHPGNFAHLQFIYEENIHVPYFISIPGVVDGEIRAAAPISLLDTAPTVLDLIGLPAPAGYQGTSALENRVEMALFYTDYSLGFLGLRDGSWKYIYELESGRSKLFDLDQDPAETADTSAKQPGRVVAYRTLLMDWSETQKALILREAHSLK